MKKESVKEQWKATLGCFHSTRGSTARVRYSEIAKKVAYRVNPTCPTRYRSSLAAHSSNILACDLVQPGPVAVYCLYSDLRSERYDE
jgi:hypothetical protein